MRLGGVTSNAASGVSRARCGRRSLVSVLLVAVTGLVGASPQEPVKRVISLVPGATEMVFAIGAGDLVVGVGSHDTWPPQIEGLPRVGALIDPDLERILDLAPDLVIVDPTQRALISQLASAGIATHTYATDDIASVLDAARSLGRQLGRAAAGDAEALRIEQRLAQLRERHRRARAPTTMLVFGRREVGFRNLYINGGTGFLHELVEIAGGTNVFADVTQMSFKAGLETVLSRAPEVIVEVRPGSDRGQFDEAAVIAQWRSLPGFEVVVVAVLASDAVMVPGPRLPEAAEEIARILHQPAR